ACPGGSPQGVGALKGDLCKKNINTRPSSSRTRISAGRMSAWIFPRPKSFATSSSSIGHILARGWLQGTLPLSLARALRPPPGYWHLDFLERGLQTGWRVEPILKAAVELQQLQAV